MIYVFQEGYDVRLKNWHDLREELHAADLQTKCVEVDKWWQKAPLVSRYLDNHSVSSWPDPWELLAENNYCETARALGMFYTMSLLGVTGIDFVQGKIYNDNVVLLLIDCAKYVMNYWPDSVVNSNLRKFTITNSIDIQILLRKIGQ